MKVIFTMLLIAVIGGLWFLSNKTTEPAQPSTFVEDSAPVLEDASIDLGVFTDAPLVTVVTENLSIPWEVVFLPAGEMLVTERPGRVVLLKSGTELTIPNIAHTGEGGLLGAALHPNFVENNYVYLYHTTEVRGGLSNRIVRYTLTNKELAFDKIIINNLPGARFHDGGRIAFGPDGYLYATIGDATRPEQAQNPESLEGTIIRLTDEGDIPTDNPSGTAVYSYGHRNPQGLAWDIDGNLWSTEHGRSGIRSGFDELNLIESGKNYGWPESQGDDVADETIGPIRHSTASVTWAPGGLAYHDGSLYIPGLRGETLYEAVLEGTEIIAWYEHFIGEYGRLRTVVVGPDNFLYLLTSNRDGRSRNIAENDDQILRINPEKLDRK